MPATSSVSSQGNKYIDGILTGTKWATTTLTYSFPSQASYYGSGYGKGEPNNNFEAFTPAQQSAETSVLAMYAAVANLTFTKVTETSSQHGDLRFAESDQSGTAFGYYPSTSAAGGDAWFNNSSNYYDNPAKGNYAWLTMIHETGHTLGLKHPQDTIGSFGPMPADRDSLEYTVMSYRSYIGASTSNYTNAGGSYPQTLMMYDIAATQALYGANYKTNSGNTIYRWDPNTGEMFVNGTGQGAPVSNIVFMTLWDGGGTDTYDFSNYTAGVTVSLQPGEWTTASTQQLANLGNGHYATGNIANALLYKDNPASLIENAIGGTGNDTIKGNAANNTFTGGGGNDSIDGQGGIDTALYSGNASDYSYAKNADGSWNVTDLRAGGPDGVDTLRNVEFLKFKDSTIDLGTSGSQTATAGSDTVLASVTYTLSSKDKNLTLTGTAAVNGTGNTLANVITGNDAANSLSGLAGDDTLIGLGGNDTLNGGAGADKMFGGLGNDTYVVDNVGDVVDETGGNGTDTVQSSISFSLGDPVHAIGAIENLTLTGWANINGTGNALDNVILGNSGANTLIGGAGADRLDGGGGVDTASYATSASGVAVSLATGIGSGGDAEGDRLSNIENLTGSNFDDTLEGNAGNNKLVGGLGSDTVSYAHATSGANGVGVTVDLSLTTAQNTVRAGTDTLSGFENLTGSQFNDTLRGTSGNNVLTGLGGNDKLTGGGGNDTFVFKAGFGKDTITDFAAGPNSGPHDTIAIDHTLFADFDAVMASSAQVGANTMITVDAQNSITLTNVKLSSLHQDDFAFV